MEVQNQPKLGLDGVDFVDLKLTTTAPYDLKTEIKLDITPKVFYPQDNEYHFKIIMDILLKSESFFEIKLLSIGGFRLDGNFNEDTKRNFVNVNAPAIMFPYVRSFISTLTSNLGNVTGHILIPAQFFKGELEEIVPSENTNTE